ncbi:MAG: ATP-binding protein [Candidatus Gastranaerophilaceae bacterium]
METQPPQEETKVTQEKIETQAFPETDTIREQAETFRDEDFAMEEVEDNELIDFSDGENIDETHNDADLLSLADNQENSITQELKKENIEAKPIINADAAPAKVKTPVKEEEKPKPVITPENTEPDADIQSHDQMKSKNLIVNAVRKPEKLIIGLSAPEGYGKSTVLRYLFGDLMHQNYAWLWGECSANSQISPYGIFQEMILTFFNMPNFSNMSTEFLKQAKTMLSESLPFFTQEEIFNLFNFLYPSLTAHFEDILINKDTTFALLEKLILEISKKAKLILVIDDFDMIDGASYAFLSYFVDQGHLGENIKLIISYKDNRITQGYFYSERLAQNQYEDIRLAKLSRVDAQSCQNVFKRC